MMPNFMDFMVCRQYVANIPQSSLSQISIDIPDLFGYWPPHVRHAARLWHGLPLGSLTAFFFLSTNLATQKQIRRVYFSSNLPQNRSAIHAFCGKNFSHWHRCSEPSCRLHRLFWWSEQGFFYVLSCPGTILHDVFFFSLSPEGVKLSGLGARLSTNSASSCQAGRSC